MALQTCRICLEEAQESEMFDLFDEEKSDNDDEDDRPQIYEIVELCCGVRISMKDELPRKICFRCFDLTRTWESFRRMCIDSQVYLESSCRNKEEYPDGFDFNDENAYLEYLLIDVPPPRPADNNRDNLSVDYEVAYDDTVDDEDNDDAEHILSDVDSKPSQLIEIITATNIKKESFKPKSSYTRKSGEAKKKNTNKARSNKGNDMSLQTPNSFMCSICGNVYYKKASFTYHMGLHSNKKPHDCELCGKAFRQMSELKSHMRRHTGEKPYKCTYCDRRFIDRSEKHRHERVHTNSRPYTCNICGKSFTYSTILKNHSKLHTGEKDFDCHICNKSFSLRHQLKAHFQTTVHKQKELQSTNAIE